jgi:hypothetical protein
MFDRLTTTAACWTTGAGAGLGLGLGLTTPVKPMLPKVCGTSGAWAAEGAATATATAREAGAIFVMGVAAEAGRAREATMAPDMTNTAETLLAGLAEREKLDEKDGAELKWLGARWRPVLWLDIVRKPLQTPTRSAVGFGWENCTRPSRRRIDKSRPPPRGLHPKERLYTPQNVGPPLLPSGC